MQMSRQVSGGSAGEYNADEQAGVDEQAPGVGDGQGNLACCSPWGCKESDKTERLN